MNYLSFYNSCNSFANSLMREFKVEKFNYLPDDVRIEFYKFTMKCQVDVINQRLLQFYIDIGYVQDNKKVPLDSSQSSLVDSNIYNVNTPISIDELIHMQKTMNIGQVVCEHSDGTANFELPLEEQTHKDVLTENLRFTGELINTQSAKKLQNLIDKLQEKISKKCVKHPLKKKKAQKKAKRKKKDTFEW